MLNTNRCTHCQKPITVGNPLRTSGAHDLGCARCYHAAPLRGARVHEARAGYRLGTAR